MDAKSGRLNSSGHTDYNHQQASEKRTHKTLLSQQVDESPRVSLLSSPDN